MTDILRPLWRLAALGLIAALTGSGCATTGGAANSIVPTRFETRTGPYVVYTHTALPADSPAVRQLQALERQVESTLGVRADAGGPPIEIYILSDQQTFEHFLRIYYPELPTRRAFFLAQGSRRVVYTYFNPQLECDLRHEATHALLHLAYAELPLWLDEGLAEFFEVPEERQGLNAEHIAKLPSDLASGWTPNLARLERIEDVRLMSPRDYRESWGWVHYLLLGSAPGKAALLGYLADHRTAKESPERLSKRLGAGQGDGPASGIAAYLGRLREPVARMQDSPLDVATKPTATPAIRDVQRSLFGRLIDRFRD